MRSRQAGPTPSILRSSRAVAAPALLAAAVGCADAGGEGEAAAAAVERHLAAAEAAAGEEHRGLFDRICVQATTPAPQPRAGGGGGGASPDPPPRAEWYAEPARVFDDLWFVGQTEYTAWAVTTSEGIVVIDPVYDWSVEAAVVEGLEKLGFDPGDIRYVLVSHAHRDHVGGARHLQERFGARVMMGEADWELLERSTASWPKPVRDIAVGDADVLRLGDHALELHLTPGHTPGTISTLLPVRDGERRHVAALWGGTAFNFLNDPEAPHAHWYRAYIESAERFRDLARAAGADVLISNHSNFDGSKTKLPALAARGPGDSHPYVVGTESVERYLTVAAECARAGLAHLEQTGRALR